MLANRNLELKSQVESLESEVNNFKALIIQKIRKQNSAKIPTSFIAAPIPMASTSTYDPTDLSFLDDVHID